MRMNLLHVLGLSLCLLLLSSFHGVSSQDDGRSGLSTLDLIEREYQEAIVNDAEKIQSEKQNTTVTDKKTISLSLSDESDAPSTASVDNSTEAGAIPKGSNLLDQIELEFEAHLNGVNQAGPDAVIAESKDDEELSAQRQKMLEDIERDFEAASTSLKQLKIGESSEGDDDEQSAKRKSLLEEIEREFEAATKDLEQFKVNDFSGDKDDQELSEQRRSMLEAIEREFEAAAKGLEELQASRSTENKDDEEQSAKRLSMLEEIEREFEAASKSLKQLNANDITADKVVEEQDEKRQSMLEEIEREFEAASSSLKELNEGNAGDEQSAKRNSMLEEMEREFEAASKSLEQQKVSGVNEGSDKEEHSAARKSMLEEMEREFESSMESLKQMKTDEQSSKRKIMLEEMEREFEEAHSSFTEKVNKEKSAKKQSSGDLGLGEPRSACGCMDGDSSIVIPTKFSIEEVLSEESAIKGTETSSLTASLTHLVQSHRKEKESHNVHRDHTSSSSTSESAVSSENVETLRAKLKELRGLSALELIKHRDFEKILITAARYEELSSASISYISRLAKYSDVIKQGLGASERVHVAKARAKLLKENASEKQAIVDEQFANAKTLAQRGDALSVRIFAIKKLLAKLEAEKESVDGEFKETMKGLSRFLADASEAYEEYHEAVRKAKDEEAAEEFAREATQSAEEIWIKFLSSL